MWSFERGRERRMAVRLSCRTDTFFMFAPGFALVNHSARRTGGAVVHGTESADEP